MTTRTTNQQDDHEVAPIELSSATTIKVNQLWLKVDEGISATTNPTSEDRLEMLQRIRFQLLKNVRLFQNEEDITLDSEGGNVLLKLLSDIEKQEMHKQKLVKIEEEGDKDRLIMERNLQLLQEIRKQTRDNKTRPIVAPADPTTPIPEVDESQLVDEVSELALAKKHANQDWQCFRYEMIESGADPLHTIEDGKIVRREEKE